MDVVGIGWIGKDSSRDRTRWATEIGKDRCRDRKG